VSQGISDSYLRWRGIEATLALAQSPNTKIVIIGSGKDGLPIILGNDVPAAAAPAAGAAPPAGGSAAGTAPSISAAPAPPSVPQPKPPAGASGEATPPDGDKAANASSTPPPSDGQEATTTPLTLSDVQGLLSRISGGLVPPATAPSPQAAAKPTR
jgi:hypothetical protein